MISATWTSLGRGLAELHRCTTGRFGFDADNYIGSTVQKNESNDSWPDFFRKSRLLFQADLARANNLWHTSWNSGFDRLCNHLDELLPERPEASLVHGDLWAGNVLADTDGNPVLLDPAVYYGHREVDLAMSSLFGSFPNDFYRAYQEEWPLEEGYNSRKEIYNLFHLINHLNLFGASYASSVESVLVKF
jgi:fructosamine-3-kinase